MTGVIRGSTGMTAAVYVTGSELSIMGEDFELAVLCYHADSNDSEMEGFPLEQDFLKMLIRL